MVQINVVFVNYCYYQYQIHTVPLGLTFCGIGGAS